MPLRVYSITLGPEQRRISPEISLIRAHSTGRTNGSLRINDSLFRSHKNACPSAEAVKSVLNALLTAIVVTGDLCPKRLDLGSNSTGFPGKVCNAYTETTQSSPAVINVLESAKQAHEIWPMWRFSKSPAGFVELAT